MAFRSQMSPFERGEWTGPSPRYTAVKVGTCPQLRLDAKHYRPDGSCMCSPPTDESLESQLIRGEN